MENQEWVPLNHNREDENTIVAHERGVESLKKGDEEVDGEIQIEDVNKDDSS